MPTVWHTKRLLGPRRESSLRIDAATSHSTNVRRERSLREAHGNRERGGEDRLQPNRSATTKYAVPRGRRPSKTEPEIAVERASRKFEVVGEDEKRPDDDEHEEPRVQAKPRARDRDGARDRRKRQGPEDGGRDLGAERPAWSSSSAWAPTPSARKRRRVRQRVGRCAVRRQPRRLPRS